MIVAFETSGTFEVNYWIIVIDGDFKFKKLRSILLTEFSLLLLQELHNTSDAGV